MNIKTLSLWLPLLLASSVLGQTTTNADGRAPLVLRYGANAYMGAHGMYGDLETTIYGETASYTLTSSPEINPSAGLGMTFSLGKEGGRLSGNLNVGFGMQYHHFSYSWIGFSRRNGEFHGTQKVAAHVLSTDFALRLKYSGRGKNPVSVSVGLFGGNNLATRHRSYVKLERGNIIQPIGVGTPAGPLMQVSRKMLVKSATLEPYVEARLGVNMMTGDVNLRNAALHLGVTYWLGK